MTAGFETLIYTDCRPGKGLRGTAGMQFQAKSSGASAAAMSLVQGNLLYEAPANWMRERRPASEYPPSFAHVAGDYLATGAGIYLGKEANGGREGNQLTHSIVTMDAGSYGLIRPAQLFQAPFWVRQPSPSTQTATLTVGWQAGPFGPIQAQEMVRSTPDGARLLVALITALRNVNKPGSKRVLFIARKAEAVLHWITAATLLLPQADALRVGFKVFTADPSHTTQPVLAINPDWGSSAATVENALGYHVFDLLTSQWTATTSAPDAARWVDLFLTEDPYDVMDAVEFTAASGLPERDAMNVALAAVLRQPPTIEHARAIANWLRTGPAGLVDAYGPGLQELLLASGDSLPTSLLRELDGGSLNGQRTPQVASIRLALIRSELQLARGGGATSTTPVKPMPSDQWTDSDVRQAWDMVVSALRESRGPRFAAVLQVAAVFGVRVTLTDITDAAHAFVDDWIANPSRGYDAGRWNCWPELQELIRARLNKRISNHAGLKDRIGREWVDTLSFSPTLTTQLDEALASTFMQRLSEAERVSYITRSLNATSADMSVADTYGRLVSVFFRFVDPTPAELRMLIREVPDGTALDQHIFEPVIERILRESLVPHEYIDLCRDLIDRRLLRPTPPLRAIVKQSQQARDLINLLGDPNLPVQMILEQLNALPHNLVVAYWSQFLDVLTRGTAAPNTVVVVLKAFPELRAHYAKRLSAALHGGDARGALAITAMFVLRENPPLMDESLQEQVRLCLSAWVNRVSTRRIQEATTYAETFGEGRAWQRILDNARRPGVVGAVRKIFGRRGR